MIKTILELKWMFKELTNEKNEIQFRLDNKIYHYNRTNFVAKIWGLNRKIDLINSDLNREDNSQIKLELVNTYKCEDCQENFTENDDFIKHSKDKFGKIICQECRENYIFCADCNSVLNKDDSYYNDQNSRICESCHDDYIYCEDCNHTFHIDDSKHYNSIYYCKDCFHDKFVSCYNCGDIITRDYSYYSERDDNNYCENCYPCQDSEEFDSTQINFHNNTFKDITSQRKFGIELEISSDDIDYSSIKNNTCFGCKEDSSLNRGAEIYSPILQGDKGYREVKKLCNITENYDNDHSAGCHIHLDFRNNLENFESIKNVYYLYLRIESIIYKLIHPRRKSNSFSKPSEITSEDIYNTNSIDDIKQLYRNEHSNSRYYGFNLEALKSHGTIELRYREGLNKFDDIINWVKLNLYLFEYALKTDITKLKTITSNINSLDRFITFIGIISNRDYKLINYWILQFNKYNPIFNENLTKV